MQKPVVSLIRLIRKGQAISEIQKFAVCNAEEI